MRQWFFALSVSCGICWAACCVAEDPSLSLGKRGKPLLTEKFDGQTVPDKWKKNTGAMKLQDGALRLSELAEDKHIGAFRYALPIQNVAIKLDFQLDGAKAFQLGFDPAPGELKKKGHLYAVSITAKKWSLVENNDKSQLDSKPKVHDQAGIALESNKWYTLVLENKGEDVVATIAGQGTLKAKATDFKVKKPALVFRAGGPDSAGVLIDNLEVHELD